MTAPHLELLAKLLRQTESENDHEALAAMRRAQVIMRKHSITWEQVIAGAAAPVEEDPEAAEVHGWFAAIDEANRGGPPSDFVESLRAQWDRQGTLSPRQREVLSRMARDARAGAPRGGRR